MAHSTSPALYADHVVAFVQDTQSDGFLDTPLETAIDVFLPYRLVEVWLLFWEEEGIDAAV